MFEGGWDFDAPNHALPSRTPRALREKILYANAAELYRFARATRQVVARAGEIAPGERKLVTVRGRSIGIFTVDGEFLALRNRCPHQGAPLCAGDTPRARACAPARSRSAVTVRRGAMLEGSHRAETYTGTTTSS